MNGNVVGWQRRGFGSDRKTPSRISPGIGRNIYHLAHRKKCLLLQPIFIEYYSIQLYTGTATFLIKYTKESNVGDNIFHLIII